MSIGGAGIIRPAGSGHVITAQGVQVEVKADGDETGKQYALLDYLAPPQFSGPPAHWHRAMEEAFFVLEGEVSAKLGEREFTADEGAFVLIPRGVWHAFSNPGPRPARLLWIYSPPGLERYFDEMAALTAHGGPPDRAAMAEVLGRYDIVFDPPPG